MAGFDDRQDRLHQATSVGALRAEQQFAPDHRRPHGALAGVVGWFDTVHVQKRPQPVAVLVQRIAQALQFGMAAEHSAQQEVVDLPANRSQQAQQARSGDRSVTAARPMPEQFLRGTHQVMPEPFDLVVGMVNQRLKIPVSDAPSTTGAGRSSSTA